jgi:hypothetical protein
MDATAADVVTVYRETGYLFGHSSCQVITKETAYDFLLNRKINNLEKTLNEQMKYLEDKYKTFRGTADSEHK